MGELRKLGDKDYFQMTDKEKLEAIRKLVTMTKENNFTLLVGDIVDKIRIILEVDEKNESSEFTRNRKG